MTGTYVSALYSVIEVAQSLRLDAMHATCPQRTVAVVMGLDLVVFVPVWLAAAVLRVTSIPVAGSIVMSVLATLRKGTHRSRK
jgi:hypothetical protein